MSGQHRHGGRALPAGMGPGGGTGAPTHSDWTWASCRAARATTAIISLEGGAGVEPNITLGVAAMCQREPEGAGELAEGNSWGWGRGIYRTPANCSHCFAEAEGDPPRTGWTLASENFG